MPRGDGTGPSGMGPMTGRAAGYCAGYAVPGFMNAGSGLGSGMAWGRGGGRGMAMAWGRGPGRGWRFAPGIHPAAYAPPGPTPEEELAALRSQADWLVQQTDAINARIRELQDAKE